mgnify:FL=1
MKRILTFIFALIVVSCQAQLRNILWNTPYYEVNYSQVYEQPLAIIYRVCGVDGTASRKGMYFHTEAGVKTSDDEYYVNNEWDKGHMAPAASLNCEEDMLWETFSYMNCALQHEKLNRGVWKTLEERERELSRQSGLMAEVFIEVDFTENPDRVPGGAAIPYGFYKEIFIGDLRECYWFKNEAPQSKNLNKYECECRN